MDEFCKYPFRLFIGCLTTFSTCIEKGGIISSLVEWLQNRCT